MTDTPTPNLIPLFVIMAVFLLIIVGLKIYAGWYSINGIKNKTVGDGQHGTARWASKSELRSYYRHLPFDPEHWRQQAQDGTQLQLPPGVIVGAHYHRHRPPTVMVELGDVNVYVEACAGWYKTTGFFYPNIEYGLATGTSMLIMDTKGDPARKYGAIAQQCYGSRVAVIDLRNPSRSHGNNLLYMVNKNMDLYQNTGDIHYRAKAERHAKILAKAIIYPTDSTDYGVNSFFYSAAEGLLAAMILIVAEFAQPEQRHIVSVIKLIQEMMAPTGNKGMNQFAQLMNILPAEHKARLFAGAALTAEGETVASIMSTVLSRMNDFLDSEIEQILCFDSVVDAEEFCSHPTAIFLVLPEENPTTYFIASLMVDQLYREILSVADAQGGHLQKRCLFLLDEFGTIPPISCAQSLFSAGRSRGLNVIAACQSQHQLVRNYTHEGAGNILKNCQLTLSGGFAAIDSSAETISKALDSRTVLTGSVSRNENNPSESLQMTHRDLMTPGELRMLQKGDYVVMQSGNRPFISRLKYYLDWGIRFPAEDFRMPDRSTRQVTYADLRDVKGAIIASQQVFAAPSTTAPVPQRQKKSSHIRTE